jgi:ABC-type glutathione transport system ATPase component
VSAAGPGVDDDSVVLRALELSLRYPRRAHPAVDAVSLVVRAARTVAICGDSGAGKSSLLLLLARLRRPSSGRVLWQGDDVTTQAGAALLPFRRAVQLVHQDARQALDPLRTVAAEIGSGLEAHGIARGPARAAHVEALLAEVGLGASMSTKLTAALSGGERQRVSLARALALSPRVLLLDEPTASLDASVRAQIVNLLLDLQQSRGVAMVLVTHDEALAQHVAHERFVMRRGAVTPVG